MTRESIDINDIKEITKKKYITKIINIINNITYFYNPGNYKLYTYNNIYIIYNLTRDIYYIYDKKEKSLIKNGRMKYCISTNNNIILKFYNKNKLLVIYILRCGKLKYSYNYQGKIKNDKYKANYRLLYICFVLYMPIELIFHIIYKCLKEHNTY
jgi:hypothetical protein